jgi:hypothetical protein
MTYNFNINPYYDDYSDEKNFYRILFKPGRAVQARELTQLQTILKNQISRFSNHIFRDGAVVSDAKIFVDDSCFFIKCQTQFEQQDVDFSTIEGRYIRETSTGKIALVKKFESSTDTDPPTIFVSIIDGNQLIFGDNSTFEVSQDESFQEILFRFKSANTESSGESLLFHITEGIHYAKETFLFNTDQTIVLSKYSKVSSHLIGFDIVESIVDASTDTSLLDPALGSSNYLAPGADRYKIDLILTTKPYVQEEVSYENFLQIASVRNGRLESDKRIPIYSDLADTLARRTYDESGDYIVRNFIPKLYENANNDSQLVLEVSAGKAYVRGYEIERISPSYIDVQKARSTQIDEQYQINTFYGNYVYVRDLVGRLPNINTNYEVEIHSDIENLSSSTLVGKALIRNLDYYSGSDTDTIFSLFLTDVNLISNFISAKCFVVPDGSDYDNPLFKVTIDQTSITEGSAIISEPTYNKLIFNVPQKFIENLTNVEYDYKQKFTRTVTSNTITIQATVNHDFYSASTSPQRRLHYTVVNTTTGEFIPVDEANVSISITDNFATINFGTSDYNGDSVDVIATVKTENDSRRVKTLVTNFVKEVTIANTDFVSLGKSDIFQLNYVYELQSNETYIGSWSSATTYSANDVVMYANTAYVSIQNDNTNRQPDTQTSWWTPKQNSVDIYNLDNGQRDNYYDHGSISRKVEVDSSTQVLALFDYFTHSGSGHISVKSYPNSISYSDLQTYTTSDGTLLRLRDCIDFRPRRVDDSATLTFATHVIPQGLTNVFSDVEYYLRRIDKIVLTKKGNFKVIQGVPRYFNPRPPEDQEDGITLFILTYEPYTDTADNVKIKILPYRRFTMKDIGSINDRLTRVEYYTSLSLLEQEIESKSFVDNNGDALFKNGFLVDSFKGHNIGDVTNSEYLCSIDYTNGIMRPLYESHSIPLVLADTPLFDYVTADPNLYPINTNVRNNITTINYNDQIYINQPLASTWNSLNPFDLVSYVGTLKLYPSSDTWYDTEFLPDIIENVDGVNDNYENFLSLETQWNAWETIWTGEQKLEDRLEVVGDRQLTKTKYEITEKQVKTGVETLQAPPSVVLSTTTKTISQSVIPYTRSKPIRFEVYGMAPNTELFLYINGRNMSRYLRSSFYDNVILSDTDNGFPVEGVYTDVSGYATGTIIFPSDDFVRFLCGDQNIIICDQPFDYKLSSCYAEFTYTTHGTLITKQNTVVSTRSGYTVRRNISLDRDVVYEQERVTNDEPWYDPKIPDATYSLVSSKTSVIEGNTISFIFTGVNVPAGRPYIANITGTITSDDIAESSSIVPGVPFTIRTEGSFGVNKYVINVPIKANNFVQDDKTIIAEVTVPRDVKYPRFGSVDRTYKSTVAILEKTSPTITATANNFINEGSNVVVIVSASNLQPSANIGLSYNVTTPISSSNISGNNLTGIVFLTAAANTQSLNFKVDTGINSPTGVQNFAVALSNTTIGTTLTTNTTVRSPTPLYYVSTDTPNILEGQQLVFKIETKNVNIGNTINYVLTGVSSANINGASLSGTTTVLANGVGVVVLTTTDDDLVKPNKTINLRVTDGGLSTTNSVSAIIRDNGAPTFALSSNKGIVSEGSSFVITLDTTKVSTGSSVGYSISGVSSADLSGASLTGNFTTLANGKAFLTLTAASDGSAESPETFSIALTSPSGATSTPSVTVKLVDIGYGDPVWTVKSDKGTVDEREDVTDSNTVTFNIQTQNISSGSIGYYKLIATSGNIVDADFVSKSSGSFVLNSSGEAAVSIDMLDDNKTEGLESFKMVVYYPDFNTSVSESQQVLVNDNSFPKALKLTASRSTLEELGGNRRPKPDQPGTIQFVVDGKDAGMQRRGGDYGNFIHIQIKSNFDIIKDIIISHRLEEGGMNAYLAKRVDPNSESFSVADEYRDDFSATNFFVTTHPSNEFEYYQSTFYIFAVPDRIREGDETFTVQAFWTKSPGEVISSNEVTIAIKDTSFSPPSIEITSPASELKESWDGTGIVEWNILSTNILEPVTTDWTVTNPVSGSVPTPGGSFWLTEAPGNDGTVNITGQINYEGFVDINEETNILYIDGTNNPPTQLFAQKYPGKIWSTPEQQYNSWVRNDEWRKKIIEGGKAVFGQWYYEKYRSTIANLKTPLNSTISGKITLQPNIPVKIRLLANVKGKFFNGKSPTQGKIRLDILGKSSELTIKESSNPFTISFDPKTRKLTGTGDFLDSKLTVAQLLKKPTDSDGAYSILYFTDGKTLRESASDPNSVGKVLVTEVSYNQNNGFLTHANAILNIFRTQNKLNRNPTLNEFKVWFEKLIYSTLNYGGLTGGQKQLVRNWYPVSSVYASHNGPEYGQVSSSSSYSDRTTGVVNYSIPHLALSELYSEYGSQTQDYVLMFGFTSSNMSSARATFDINYQSDDSSGKNISKISYTQVSLKDTPTTSPFHYTKFSNQAKVNDVYSVDNHIELGTVNQRIQSPLLFTLLKNLDLSDAGNYLQIKITTSNSGGCQRADCHSAYGWWALVPYQKYKNTLFTTWLSTLYTYSSSIMSSAHPVAINSTNITWINKDSKSIAVSYPYYTNFNDGVNYIESQIQNYARKNGEFFNSRVSFLACTTDPLAQTFFVSQAAHPDGIFVSKVGLYFKQKDDKLPVFLQIRPTTNGFPSSSQVVPLSTVWKNANEISVSDDVSIETIFEFDAPIYLPPGEHSIVVGSNSSKYLAFCAEVGGLQLGTGNIISEQPYVGSLFKSQNATTWTPEQKQDLTFKMYSCNFDTANTTHFYLTNTDYDRKIEYHSFKVTTEQLDVSEQTDFKYSITTFTDGVSDDNEFEILENKNTNLTTTKTLENETEVLVRVDMESSNPELSPLLDIDRTSLIAIKNIISSESESVIPETLPFGGDAKAKYVSRPVTLADGFDANKLRVILDINRPEGTSIKVFFKVKASEDPDEFRNKYYQEMQMVSKLQNFTLDESTYITDEYIAENISYSSDDIEYYEFKTYAIKIVMYSDNPAFVPQIKNLRVIALT